MAILFRCLLDASLWRYSRHGQLVRDHKTPLEAWKRGNVEGYLVHLSLLLWDADPDKQQNMDGWMDDWNLIPFDGCGLRCMACNCNVPGEILAWHQYCQAPCYQIMEKMPFIFFFTYHCEYTTSNSLIPNIGNNNFFNWFRIFNKGRWLPLKENILFYGKLVIHTGDFSGLLFNLSSLTKSNASFFLATPCPTHFHTFTPGSCTGQPQSDLWIKLRVTQNGWPLSTTSTSPCWPL